MKKPDLNRILEANPQLNRERIERFRSYQERMERAGLTTRAEYLVEPALGSLTAAVGRQRRQRT